MTLQQRISALITAIGADIKALYGRALPSGGTTGQILAKSSGTNYAVGWVDAPDAGAVIDDVTPGTDTTYSSDKIDTLITDAKADVKDEILGGVGTAYDTLQEIATELGDQDSAISGLLTSVGNRLRFDAAQTLNSTQITQVCANAGLGEPDTDLAALYTTAKA